MTQEAQIRNAFRIAAANVDEIVKGAVQRGMAAGFTQIRQRWPRDTYWSDANHTIVVDGKRSGPSPADRPDERGALASHADMNESLQLGKLLTIKAKNIDLSLENPVPYAGDVGHIRNYGHVIYAEAAARIEQVMVSEIAHAASLDITKPIHRRTK